MSNLLLSLIILFILQISTLQQLTPLKTSKDQISTPHLVPQNEALMLDNIEAIQ